MAMLSALFEHQHNYCYIHSIVVIHLTISVNRKKSPNVDKSCPKMISLETLYILTSLQKLPKNVGDLGKLIVEKGFKNLAKVQ